MDVYLLTLTCIPCLMVLEFMTLIFVILTADMIGELNGVLFEVIFFRPGLLAFWHLPSRSRPIGCGTPLPKLLTLCKNFWAIFLSRGV